MMPHNPPEYAEYLEAAGYRKVKDLYAWLYDLGRDLEPAIVKLAARLQTKHRIVVRPLELREFEREIERLRELYCGAWARNWGFVPPTPAEFRRLGDRAPPDLRSALRGVCRGRRPDRRLRRRHSRYQPGAERHRRPAVPARASPSASPEDDRRSGAIAAARRPRRIPRHRPLPAADLRAQAAAGPAHAYRRAEFSWVLEDNRDINQPVERLGARRYKTYRIYQKALT